MPASAPPPPAVYSAPPDVSTSTPAWESGAPTFDSEAAAFQETAPPAPPPVPPVTPPPPAAVAFDPAMASLLPKAQFLDRLGAFVIDILLVLVLQAFLDVGTFRGFVTLLLGYHILFWALKQTTVGGMILNLRVVRTDGQPLTFADALIRGLVSILSVAALGLGCFWILCDPDNQAWHDRFAGTWVVKAPR